MKTTPQEKRPVVDGADWSQVEPRARELMARGVADAAAFETWLLDRSDLESAIDEARAALFVATTCDTEDEAAEKAYERFIDEVPPRYMPLAFEMDKKEVALFDALPMDERRYKVLRRSKRAQVELFRAENVPIQTELAKLEQEFGKITGVQLVDFDGERRTMPQMAAYLEKPDRAVREAAWRAIWARRLADRERFDDLLGKLIERRHKMATNAGYPDYISYTFVAKERFDYAPADCRRFWEGVEKHVVPLMRRLDRRRREDMNVDPLRPWDLSADPRGRPGLRPFDGGRDLVAKTMRTFESLDPRLAAMFGSMAGGALGPAPGSGPEAKTCKTPMLDLDSRRGKRPGGYQYGRPVSRSCFIFMNAAGLQRDAMTMLHEAGHAFHSLLAADEPLVDYWHAPIEFCEVASMAMEHLTMPHWTADGAFYASEEDAARARREHLTDSITLLAWIAMIDAFQHWMYAHPGHGPEDRREQWLLLDARFGHDVSWQGIETERANQWQRQGHLFTAPMYYIEYGIAQLGALQLWLRSLHDGRHAAVDAYINGLRLGGSRPLPQLFEAAGLTFDLGPATIGRVTDAVETELGRLAE